MTLAPGKALFLRTCRVLLIFLGIQGAGCGSGDEPQVRFPFPDPVSCDDLSLGDPKTGGTFSCIACVRSWRWEGSAPRAPLYLLMELDCQTTTDAHLTLLGPQASVLWETRLHPGESRRFCVPHTPETTGTCSLLLSGEGPGGLTSFTGSIWINLYDRYGERAAIERSGHP
jgi:hypothetical protein